TLQTHTELLAPGDDGPPLWLPVLLVFAAALMITWFGLEQYRMPDGVLERSLAHQDSSQAADSDAAPAAENVAGADDGEPVQARTSILPRLSEATDNGDQQQMQQEQRRLGREVR